MITHFACTSDGSSPKYGKKDLTVLELMDKVGKLDFRHWVEAVEIYLESIHGWSKPDAVLNLVRREDSEVTADSLKEFVRRASEKLQEDGLGPVDSSNWGDFETRSRFLYSWLLGTIKPDMHEKVAGISNTNGYELAIPANAEFAYDQSLMQLVPMYAGKFKNLKDLYKLRAVLKNKC